MSDSSAAMANTNLRTFREAITRLRCDHRFPLNHGGAAAVCKLCGLPWVDRDIVVKEMREPLATLLTAIARMGGTPEVNAAVLAIARVVLGEGRQP